MILSHAHYILICAALTGGVAAYWIGVDTWRLRKALRGGYGPRTDRAVHDHVFGSTLGILIGIVGVVGVALYYWT